MIGSIQTRPCRIGTIVCSGIFFVKNGAFSDKRGRYGYEQQKKLESIIKMSLFGTEKGDGYEKDFKNTVKTASLLNI